MQDNNYAQVNKHEKNLKLTSIHNQNTLNKSSHLKHLKTQH